MIPACSRLHPVSLQRIMSRPGLTSRITPRTSASNFSSLVPTITVQPTPFMPGRMSFTSQYDLGSGSPARAPTAVASSATITASPWAIRPLRRLDEGRIDRFSLEGRGTKRDWARKRTRMGEDGQTGSSTGQTQTVGQAPFLIEGCRADPNRSTPDDQFLPGSPQLIV